MNLKDLTENLSTIFALYCKRFSIQPSPEYYLIKIQEELGELSSAYLKITNRARNQDVPLEDLQSNFEDEIADVIAMTVLFAKSQNIDVEKIIRNKWYKYLK